MSTRPPIPAHSRTQSSFPTQTASPSPSRATRTESSVTIMQMDGNAIEVRFQNGDVEDVIVSVTPTSLPSTVEAPPGEQVSQVNISASIPDSSIDQATVTLAISKARVPDGTSLNVYRYHDGEWVPLQTAIVKNTSTTVTVRVRTNGFSYFAVGAVDTTDGEVTTPSPTPTPTPTSTTSQPATSTNSPTVTDSQPQQSDTPATQTATTAPGTASSQATTQPKSNQNNSTPPDSSESIPGFGFGIGIAALFAFLLLIQRRENQ